MWRLPAGIQKSLIVMMFLVSPLVHQRALAQCEAVFSYTVDSVRGSIQLTNFSVKANPDSALTSEWTDGAATVLSHSTHPLLITGEGSFTVCLSIENAGCSDSSCQQIEVPKLYCKADYSYSVNQTTGTAYFISHSIGRQTTHFWSFGDGGYAIDSVTSHTFANNGWYYVCLNTINSDSSCKDVHCEFVRINKPSPEPCVAQFDYIYDSIDTKLIHFTNYTTSDSAVTYVWLFGNDDVSSDANPSYRFNDLGNYRVCLLVSGPNCADSICKTVEILQILPFCEAKFNVSLFSDSANQTSRIALLTNLSSGDNLTYLWTFGDDSTSTLNSPIHYYPHDGLYTVCLTVFNGALCTDSICSLIEINPNTGLTHPDGLLDLAVYPVPAYSELIVAWQSQTKGSCRITLSDLQGRTIEQQDIIQTASNRIVLNTENLKPGLYALTLQTELGIRNVKIVKGY